MVAVGLENRKAQFSVASRDDQVPATVSDVLGDTVAEAAGLNGTCVTEACGRRGKQNHLG